MPHAPLASECVPRSPLDSRARQEGTTQAEISFNLIRLRLRKSLNRRIADVVGWLRTFASTGAITHQPAAGSKRCTTRTAPAAGSLRNPNWARLKEDEDRSNKPDPAGGAPAGGSLRG